MEEKIHKQKGERRTELQSDRKDRFIFSTFKNLYMHREETQGTRLRATRRQQVL